MSVMLLEKKTKEKIISYFTRAYYNRTCDIFYNDCINDRKFISVNSLDEYALRLFAYNELTYSVKYGKFDFNTGIDDNLFHSVEKLERMPCNNVYECLKALQCLNYNIEIYHLEKLAEKGLKKEEVEEDIILLGKIISRLKQAIINEMPEYKNADWN